MFFRKIVFWIHLLAGLISGLIIAVMSFTGAVLAFEHEIVEWAERDVRRIEAPASATALPLDTLLAKARATAPEGAKPASLTVSRDPRDAVAINFGRDAGVYYINQYTGSVLKPASERTHDFMHLMESWHRYLALSGDQRPYGKAITGACNLAFLFLALSGLWLWWPRAWNRRLLRPSLWFVSGATGRARDWNWHNVIGFWSLPVLIVLTTSGAVIGYKWASDLVYRASGEIPQRTGGLSPSVLTVPAPANPATQRLDLPAALTYVQTEYPDWRHITVREGYARRPNPAPVIEPHTATVHADDGTPDFAPTQLVLDPHTGAILNRTSYADQTTGRKVRTWLRYLHTGQALGWPGQLIAGLASIGGLVLVYTGFALSWRRFFPKRESTSTD